jgi:hypothetical protein
VAFVFFLGSTVYAAPSLLFSGSSAESLDAIDDQGNFWGSDELNGLEARQVVKYSAVRGSVTPIISYSGSLIDNLTPKGSSVANGPWNGYVEQIWPLPDGSVLFSTIIAPNQYGYLYKLNPSTNSVGNNPPNYNNKQAVMNMGERGNGRVADVRTLHHRSLLVGTVGGATVLFYGEYNLNATQPRVALWKSTTMGDTWTRVIEWNAVGHQTRHIHAVVQNPYNQWIYILFGDPGSDAGIVAWDGVSVPPPDNTPLNQIGSYSGWRSLTGSQAVRTGDLVFTPPPNGKCIWIPDVDSVNPGESLYSQRANYDLSGLEAIGKIPYTNGIPPILGYRDEVSGNIYWSSFRLDGAENKIHIWSSNDSGLTWSLASKADTYNNWGAVPHNIYIAPWGELVISARDLEFVPNGLSNGSSAYFSVSTNSGNTAPVANNDIAITTQNQAVTIKILANDTDAESNIAPDSVTIGTQPANGSLALNADGSVIFTPASGFTGINTFTYTVKDTLGLTSNLATVTVTVIPNTAPTFVGGTSTLRIRRNSSAVNLKPNLHVSDTDTGQTETWSQIVAPSHGTLTFSNAKASSGSTNITPGGTITYRPVQNYIGPDSFAVRVSDGVASAIRTFTVTVVR